MDIFAGLTCILEKKKKLNMDLERVLSKNSPKISIILGDTSSLTTSSPHMDYLMIFTSQVSMAVVLPDRTVKVFPAY